MVQAAEYCLLWIQWGPLCMPRSEWASWVQAVGSIVAILGAWTLTRQQIDAQARLAEEAEKRATNRAYDAIRAVLDGAAKQFLKLQPVMSDENTDEFGDLELMFHYEDRSFDDAINALETVRLIELGSYELVEAIAGIKIGMVKLRHAVNVAKSERDPEEEPDHQIRAYGDDVIRQLNRHYHKAIGILGGDPILHHTWADD
jgi:hypothetical protein